MSWTVVGQQPAVKALARAVADGRVAHAYLFAGPLHTGKTLTALQFAQALNCTGEEPPCGRCRACERIAAHTHPDVEIVTVGGLCDEGEHRHAADERDIRICHIRRLDRIVTRAPFEGRCRVVIIEPADAMNDPAANALLKTLEEPPPRTVLILITGREEMLLETIRSRARRIAFAGLPRADIERALRDRWDVEPARAAELARLSSGRLGWAVAALHDERMMQQRAEALARAEELAGASLTPRFAFASELGNGYTRDRARVHALLEVWQTWWRDLLLIAAGRQDEAVLRERLDTLRPLAAQCGVPGAARALRALADARQQLDENASPVLALEALMLALPELRPNPVADRLGAGPRRGG
ncbi:MAG: DNA polymerase III subunit delta' [Chloroflexota bacterium]|nr:DNA polymerase III subunit delta' [Chloroflexota bacterium]